MKGILFGRKACGVMSTLRCRRCHAAVCNEHAFFDEDLKNWSSVVKETGVRVG